VDAIPELTVHGEVISNRQDIADFLDSFFLFVAENNTNKNFKTNCKPLDYLHQTFNHPFPKYKISCCNGI
jgi:hypothetical protein